MVAVEAKILEIYDMADKLREELELPKEMVQVEISLANSNFWQLQVIPSLLTHGTQTMVLKRGYHGDILSQVLADALKGTTEELELARKNLTRGF
jgi:hypothetical protein